MVLRLRVGSPGGWPRAKCPDELLRDCPCGEVFSARAPACPACGAAMQRGRIVSDPFFEDDQQDYAVAVCNGDLDGETCPHRDQCLIFALTNNEKHGVFGGMTPADRKALRKKWPLRHGKVPRPEWAWYPPGTAGRLLTDQERAELDAEEDQARRQDG